MNLGGGGDSVLVPGGVELLTNIQKLTKNSWPLPLLPKQGSAITLYQLLYMLFIVPF